jgi:superfamily II DNA/RNA helicase
VHRVGRTGRAGAAGAALTLASPQEAAALASLDAALAARRAEVGAAGGDEDGDDDVALAAGDGDGADVASDEAPLQVLRPYSGLAASAVEALRYRADDCARACGKAAVREARLRELRAALLQSSRLAAHFEDNPAERRLLQADAPLAKAPAAPHLKHLPAYLRGGAMAPRGAAKKRKRAEAAAAADAAATGEGAAPAARRRRGDGGGGGVGDDPLKTFSLGLAAKEMAKEGAGGDAPDGDAAAAVARAMWSKGPKSERRRGKAHGGRGGAAGGPEWPVRNSAQMRKGRLNVRRGKRKTSR